MLPEKDYYSTVEEFLSKHFNCSRVKSGQGGRGYLGLGLADVVGAYDISSEYHNDMEVVVVEVKKTTSSFGKSMGQALGYSIYGERCYLAITFRKGNSFTDEQKYFADHLGIGLIKIPVDDDGTPRKNKVELVVSSKKHKPIPALKMLILNRIGISQCYSCGIFDFKINMQKIQHSLARSTFFSNKQHHNLFICKDCFQNSLPKEYKNGILSRNEAGKKAARTKKYRKAAKKAHETRRRNSMN